MFLLSIPFTFFHVATHTPSSFFYKHKENKNKKQKLPKVHEEGI
jgi:hypothetical protein